jgi:hypothetical protein
LAASPAPRRGERENERCKNKRKSFHRTSLFQCALFVALAGASQMDFDWEQAVTRIKTVMAGGFR